MTIAIFVPLWLLSGLASVLCVFYLDCKRGVKQSLSLYDLALCIMLVVCGPVVGVTLLCVVLNYSNLWSNIDAFLCKERWKVWCQPDE